MLQSRYIIVDNHMPETEEGEAPPSPKAEPVSLAVSADVAQIRLEDSPHQTMGEATAHRLKALLSHIPPPLANSLESEIEVKPQIEPIAEPLSENKDANEVIDDNVLENNNSNNKSNNSNNTQNAESGLRKFLHQVDNFFNQSSQPRHHHQGHRFNSVNETTSHHATNHNCNIGCAPAACTVPSSQIEVCGSKEEKKDNSDKPQSPPQKQKSQQHFPRFQLPFFGSNNHRRSSLKQKLHMSFLSSGTDKKVTESQKERMLKHKYRGELLDGTTTWEQHEAKIKSILHICEIYQLGYDLKEYSQKENDGNVTDDSIHHDALNENNISEPPTNALFDKRARHTLSSIGFEFRLEKCDECTLEATKDNHCCEQCTTRLYYTPSDTLITSENRRKFIADGKMYDAIADLCQSAAQEIMAETCDLVWVTICDGKGGGLSARLNGQTSSNLSEDSKSVREWPTDDEGNIIVLEPIRALVSRCHENNLSNDTFLLSTGKGKVSAGVFSRHHLLTTGLEPSTALPLLREAQSRGMNCVVIDPNARGDKVGMQTFEVSLRSLFHENGSSEVEEDTHIPVTGDGYIYVLAHSAAGGQLVRYLLNQDHGASLLPRIRSITFTDSTHSVQWLKANPHISSLMQSSKALYVRSANPMRDDCYENAKPGDACPTDHFWSHRFGQIRTVWAGTTDHSLTNWVARAPIWEHFDKNAVEDSHTSKVDK